MLVAISYGDRRSLDVGGMRSGGSSTLDGDYKHGI